MKQTRVLLLLSLALLLMTSCEKESKTIEWYPVMYRAESVNAFSNYLYKFVKPTGEEIVIDDLKEASFFRDGLSRVTFNGQKGFGFVNDKGALVIATQYAKASLFSEGLAWVQNMDANYNSPIDVINTKGEVVFSKAVRSVKEYKEGLCAFSDGQLWGFVDTKGNVVIEPTYYKVSNFSNGLAAVLKESAWGYIDTKGNFVITPQFRTASDFDENNQAIVETSEGTGVITRKNEYVIAPGTYRFIISDGNLYRASTSKIIVWHDDSGEEICMLNIDNKNITFQASASPMFNGSDKAWAGNRFINLNGIPIIEMSASMAIEDIDDVDVFHGDVAIVQGKNGLYGFIDRNGKVLVKPQYRQFGPGVPVCGTGYGSGETRF